LVFVLRVGNSRERGPEKVLLDLSATSSSSSTSIVEEKERRAKRNALRRRERENTKGRGEKE